MSYAPPAYFHKGYGPSFNQVTEVSNYTELKNGHVLGAAEVRGGS